MLRLALDAYVFAIVHILRVCVRRRCVRAGASSLDKPLARIAKQSSTAVHRRLEEYDAKRIFKDILEGLKYCHSRCITHRDIKLENLLLDDNGVVKMIDFGFSTCVPNDKKIKIFCGTPSYMGPEIVRRTEYCGPPADIWALGVLLFTCLSG